MRAQPGGGISQSSLVPQSGVGWRRMNLSWQLFRLGESLVLRFECICRGYDVFGSVSSGVFAKHPSVVIPCALRLASREKSFVANGHRSQQSGCGALVFSVEQVVLMLGEAIYFVDCG